MATVDVTSADFVNTIQDNDLVLVDFWADWCGPCKRFAPIFSKVSEKHDDVVFAKLDTDANQEIAGALNIMSIPTIMAFHKGNMVFNQAGVLNASQLEQLITQLKELPEDGSAS
ncbi:thioredoxin [Granulicoccus sp. GXG6511]|uniref:thioredoxin n=1 Tax=Granulicoccus sp. GXG6511 TaxID=3381351 RepID=UPI003D7E534C